MAFTYWLPDEKGRKQKFETTSNSIIIVGANGAGKSKLGAWIEKQDYSNVHRIGAQRNLNFQENITLKNYSQAEDLVFFGNADNTTSSYKLEKTYRWGHKNENRFTTTLLNDFDDVLAALIALKNNENDLFVRQCKEAEKQQINRPCVPVTILDKLQDIWNEVLPQRQLSLEDSKFYASFDNNGNLVKYSANQMSDGERAVLYLAAQVLCVPENKTLIIDEPEIHLHRSIMNRLWMALERYRPDCLFIYITHDTQFAAMHPNADKIWIKEYDGTNWKLKKIDGDDLPEELLLDILGSRKNVLFVEGERNSYDTQLYSELYPNYHIVPCGSCTQVIARTKAFRNNPSLHDCVVYGIIDRDYRSEHEIEKYKEENIYTINVAEVENLFIVEELVRVIAAHMAKDPDAVFAEIKKYVITDRFAKQINGQICEATVAEIKYKLMSAEISKKNDSEAKSSLDATMSEIDYDAIHAAQAQKFNDVLQRSDYSEVIKVFNCKNISTSIGRFFEIDNKAYRQIIIGLLHGARHKDIIAALMPYLPTDIPRKKEAENCGTEQLSKASHA